MSAPTEVLIEQEIERLMARENQAAIFSRVSHVKFARAVEAAVLKAERQRVGYLVKDGQVLWNGEPMVKEAEARRRERAAWREGVVKAADDARVCVREQANYGMFAWYADRKVPILDYVYCDPTQEATLRYPDLTPKAAPTPDPLAQLREDVRTLAQAVHCIDTAVEKSATLKVPSILFNAVQRIARRIP